MVYKGIEYSVNKDYNALVFEQYGEFDDEHVLRSTTLVELAGHTRPANLIIDRRKAKKPPEYFIDILEERIFPELQEYGVKGYFL